MKNVQKDITKASAQNPASESLKTTIPKDIASVMELAKGDFIKWTLVTNGKGTHATIKKLDLKY